jgi:hypothetical protein
MKECLAALTCLLPRGKDKHRGHVKNKSRSDQKQIRIRSKTNQDQIKNKSRSDQEQIKINGSGQECPLHTDGDLILNGGGAA